MNPTQPTSPAIMATLRLAEANKSAPFAAYPGWQLDLRAALDSHAQLIEALQHALDVMEIHGVGVGCGTQREARAALKGAGQ